MSEDVADLRRQLARMTSQMQRLEAASRQTWGFAPTGGGAASPPAIYIVAGGKTLTDWGSDGGRRITTALSAAALPPGAGGTPGSTVTISANPIPAGLPDGICVAARVYDGAAVFVLCDSSSYTLSDLIQGDVIIVGSTPTNFDVPSGGVTYRYACYPALARLK
jgi:hypothetical protein